MPARLMLGVAAALSLAAGMFSKPLLEQHLSETTLAPPAVAAPSPRVAIQSHIVNAPILGPESAARASAARTTPHTRRLAAPRRSLLARVLLGDGENRPQPFPRPGS